MDNPFRYAGPVSGKGFCGRESALDRVTDAALAGTPVMASGYRGMGASSLAGSVASRLADHGPVARVDLEASPGPGAARRAVSAALRRARIEPPGGLARSGGAGTRREGRGPGAGPGFLVVDGAHRLVEEDAGPLAEALASAGAGDGLVSVLFTSRPSAARSLVAREGPAAGAPAGRASTGPTSGGDGAALVTASVRLRPIPFAAWLPFVLERFLETDRWIANEHVGAAVRLTGGHPRHTQHLLHVLWDLCDDQGRVRSDSVQAAFGRVVHREGHSVRALLDSLTPNQRRVLWGLAAEGPGASPYSRGFVRRWELASPSSVQRALRALRDGNLVEEGEEGPVPADPVLAAWIRRAAADGAGGARG